MISSAYRSDLIKSNAEGDHRRSAKRWKSSGESAEDYFFRSHPFSDLVLLIDGKETRGDETRQNETKFSEKELFVDKSVLSAGSKVFQSYLMDENIDTIELLDVSAEEMLELLRFVYPQFECTITNDNVTILLVLGR